ncbi:glycerol-3-phosphate responsive antiterminator [Tuberibacillus sp. Marseille-P3662]|uniref:glycerol-3-phosphate responsive antiterminator n=1 Tax=Tuberibacillus sp. Marseille-P3662 TaxID=1965358 RepID=UPI000A1C993A|nr:glycerol-3-phosphate responsive antiterminator [Tuberibacillus sp. Marseille-P3662]
MSDIQQMILPAVRNFKGFEKLLESSFDHIVLLDTHVAHLQSMVSYAKRNHKKVFLHADLVHGLRSDEYAAEFLCQTVKPDGIISTRSHVLMTAKKKGITAIQRLFLLDSMALETSYRLIEKIEPDYLEVLPGLASKMIAEITQKTGIPIIASGLIRDEAELKQAFDSGAVAISTSTSKLWHFTIDEN